MYISRILVLSWSMICKIWAKRIVLVSDSNVFNSIVFFVFIEESSTSRINLETIMRNVLSFAHAADLRVHSDFHVIKRRLTTECSPLHDSHNGYIEIWNFTVTVIYCVTVSVFMHNIIDMTPEFVTILTVQLADSRASKWMICKKTFWISLNFIKFFITIWIALTP